MSICSCGTSETLRFGATKTKIEGTLGDNCVGGTNGLGAFSFRLVDLLPIFLEVVNFSNLNGSAFICLFYIVSFTKI